MSVDLKEEKRNKMAACTYFFNKLTNILSDTHVKMASCNADLSAYLVPKGTKDQVTYYGKPDNSFRISDHWNWYSNIKKCQIRDEVQCWSVDLPDPTPRDPEFPDRATVGQQGCQVAFYGPDRHYHCVYGDRYNHETGKYEWVETKPETIANLYKKGLLYGN